MIIMSMLSKALGIQPRVAICSCTVTKNLCKTSYLTCDGYTNFKHKSSVQVDCTTGEECSSWRIEGCCY